MTYCVPGMQSLPQPSAPSLPTHSRNSSAGGAELTQDLNLRVLIAHAAAAAAASSAPGSPSGVRTPPINPFGAPAAQASQPFEPSEAGPTDKAGVVPSAAASEDAQPQAAHRDTSEELKELISLVTGSKREGKQAQRPEPAANGGHLTAQTSATSSLGASSSAAANGDAGHLLLSSPGLSGPVWERAHSAPPMPRLEDMVGSPTSHPVRSESLLSLLGDGADSVLSAPGNVEAPVAAAEAALAAAEPLHPRPPPRTASASAADDHNRFPQGAGSLVSRYVAMFEARQPVISMPAWQRQELRGRSTDLVLRFLNRQRRPRGRAPAAASPEEAASRSATPAQHHHSDSDEHSGSDDEPDEGDGNNSDEDGSAGLRTPPRRHSSPLRGRSPGSRSSTGSPSGTPLHPSRLGDARRATTAENVRS